MHAETDMRETRHAGDKARGRQGTLKYAETRGAGTLAIGGDAVRKAGQGVRPFDPKCTKISYHGAKNAKKFRYFKEKA